MKLLTPVKLVLLAALGLLSNVSVAQSNEAKCYALVLGTGDMSAAYQAGVLSSLLNKYSAEEI